MLIGKVLVLVVLSDVESEALEEIFSCYRSF